MSIALHAPPPPPVGPPPDDAYLASDSRALNGGRRGSSVVSAVAAAPRAIAHRASVAISDALETSNAVIKAINPEVDVHTIGVDVLGIVSPPPEGGSVRGSIASVTSAYEEDDLFEVEGDGDLSPMIAGQGLTSPVLRDVEDGLQLDWAAETLLLTHEPLRRGAVANP